MPCGGLLAPCKTLESRRVRCDCEIAYYKLPVALDWFCTHSQLSIESAACGAHVKTHHCRLYNDSNKVAVSY